MIKDIKKIFERVKKDLKQRNVKEFDDLLFYKNLISFELRNNLIFLIIIF